MLSKDREPLSSDIEIAVAGFPEQTLSVVTQFMKSVGAPRGSFVVLDGFDAVPCGVTEGLGLYLNGTDLPGLGVLLAGEGVAAS